MPTPNDDQPSSPWRSDVWPSEIERVRGRREIAKMREQLAARKRHLTGRHGKRKPERISATG